MALVGAGVHDWPIGAEDIATTGDAKACGGWGRGVHGESTAEDCQWTGRVQGGGLAKLVEAIKGVWNGRKHIISGGARVFQKPGRTWGPGTGALPRCRTVRDEREQSQFRGLFGIGVGIGIGIEIWSIAVWDLICVRRDCGKGI